MERNWRQRSLSAQDHWTCLSDFSAVSARRLRPSIDRHGRGRNLFCRVRERVPGSFERSGHLPSLHCSSCRGRGFRAPSWSRGAEHWRLHAAITSATFILFPLLGFGLWAAAPHALPRSLWSGVLFVCVLPSTVQSSIALTSIARGDVAGAVCSAAGCNLAGLFSSRFCSGFCPGCAQARSVWQGSSKSSYSFLYLLLQVSCRVRGSANERSATNQFSQ